MELTREMVNQEFFQLNLPFLRVIASYANSGARKKSGSGQRRQNELIKLIMASNNTTDLTQHPPRSPRVRLGGYAILPRMLDKGRATIAGKQGEYKYACPLDQRFLDFTGIDPELLKKELAAGKGDGEILEWIQQNAKHKRTDPEIVAWSEVADKRAPSDVESRGFFNELHEKTGPKREDIVTWFDLLDLDDYVSFGGKA